MIRMLNPDTDDSRLFKMFERDSKFVKVDPDHTAKRYQEMIRSGFAAVFMLVGERDEIQGGLGAIKYPDIHSGEWRATESFWYVLPEFRGGFGAMDLLLAYEKWARDQGCKMMSIIHLADSYPEKLERLYRNRGYELVEKTYMKETGK
jgi:GNAT superfamily N-acetyltransferase